MKHVGIDMEFEIETGAMVLPVDVYIEGCVGEDEMGQFVDDLCFRNPDTLTNLEKSHPRIYEQLVVKYLESSVDELCRY